MNFLRKRFNKGLRKEVLEFSSSLKFDKRLYKYDIDGSIAHAKMLGKCGIISKRESCRIVKGLEEIHQEIENGKLKLRNAEDIHMAIEARLIQKIGSPGKKLHTARSRNDQVVLDFRMFLRDAVGEIIKLLRNLQEVILGVARKNLSVIMPGYTHLQHAQPVLFSHHIMSYFFMLNRDAQRLRDCLKRINVMPLGACALAGTSLPIDRKYVARLLGFSSVSENSIDTVSDRDFAIETLGHLVLIMVHLSRLSEELILWSSSEFNFIEIDESFCTGSSIMPQKKNPDIPELIRGKAGRVFGDLATLTMTMKGLPLSYNRDMQEDKEPVFDAVDTVKECLKIYISLLKNIKVNKDKMYLAANDGFSVATDLTDYLVKKGVPFRQAYSIVAQIVMHCIKNGKRIDELSLNEFRSFCVKFKADVYKNLNVKFSIESKKSVGGTATIRG
ncbi:argininosuccinate lyase [Candidatus Desantisbacteria bacterium CG1_02_38_46]|uniref:Argininosuccinate lyase n=3 Tax=unclassified Candidatus Desantisiibacteriota TaxID=3106372 RepID=A0A2H9PCA3_9BACT|nr:MAG: argininosuccinate lyase [Candidatus Desantisbacteria bacterium CG1_02_38_46]PIU50863.1 MAG: argininosuccinate lyase [Candidatus Desantisbacteria bacterium CG07_land_8_20_14_0_80_39_15]PIZ16776.1 MAG: argininosuccinate lyase [Candidatus Desantisbacteria bacterium CG_4_10_14_0_8_um_filter_39_17]